MLAVEHTSHQMHQQFIHPRKNINTTMKNRQEEETYVDTCKHNIQMVKNEKDLTLRHTLFLLNFPPVPSITCIAMEMNHSLANLRVLS